MAFKSNNDESYLLPLDHSLSRNDIGESLNNTKYFKTLKLFLLNYLTCRLQWILNCTVKLIIMTEF